LIPFPRFLPTALLLVAAGHASLFGAGDITVQSGPWSLTLNQNLKAGKIVVRQVRTQAATELTRVGNTANFLANDGYTMELVGLSKEDKIIEFTLKRVTNSVSQGKRIKNTSSLLLNMDVADGNSSVNPIFKPVIKKFRVGACVLFVDENPGHQFMPAGPKLPALFDVEKLSAGDIVINNADFSVLEN